MNTWIIEPLDPVIFGDGRPFSNIPGTTLRSLPLPPPSTLAGGLRTRAGIGKGGRFDISRIPQVLALSSWGPLPVQLDGEGQVTDFAFPAPADALIMEGQSAPEIKRLVPLALDGGDATDALDGAPVGLAQPDPRKPDHNAPGLWLWGTAMRQWLTSPDQLSWRAGCGVSLPLAEPRAHVSINPGTGTARDGALFATVGRAWWRATDDIETRLGMAVLTDADLQGVTTQLGGERRFVQWRLSSMASPQLPSAVVASARAGAVRVILATPGHFLGGHSPKWLLDEAPKGSRLVARANGRPQVISGWDFKQRRPKPTRRLVPAGAVYFLALGGSPDEREAWARNTWLHPVSDDQASRRDGFGLALLGTWSGTPLSLSPQRISS